MVLKIAWYHTSAARVPCGGMGEMVVVMRAPPPDSSLVSVGLVVSPCSGSPASDHGETVFVKQVIPLIRLVQTRLLVIFTLCVFTFFATRSLGLSELFLVPGLLFCVLQSVLVFGGSTVHEKNLQTPRYIFTSEQLPITSTPRKSTHEKENPMNFELKRRVFMQHHGTTRTRRGRHAHCPLRGHTGRFFQHLRRNIHRGGNGCPSRYDFALLSDPCSRLCWDR